MQNTEVHSANGPKAEQPVADAPAAAFAGPASPSQTTPEQAQAAAEPNQNVEAPGEPQEGPPPEPARDAIVHVNRLDNNMSAEVVIEPPAGEGRHTTRQDIDAALQAGGVVFGLQEDALIRLSEPLYNQAVVVARGILPVDGVDGSCTELFPRQITKTLSERTDGSVDYRELGMVNDQPAGTVVCEVTPPTEGTDGTNVLGQPLKARAGQKASLPIGEGTHATEDGLRVETLYPGHLTFRAGRFTVDKIFRVQDITYDVGNISFSGDVIVNGDMQDGFEIHSGGNVTLRGRVGSVTIVAAGSILLERGINGTGKAVLDAGRVLKADFIENCTVRAVEKIEANSIINSQVECDGDIDVTGRKGIICGGKVTSFGSVKANEIGNEFNTLTVIALGVTPRLIKERKKLTDQLADVSRHLDEMVKNMEYIERMVADGRAVPPERVQILQRSRIQMPMSEKKKEQLERAIEELDKTMATVANSTLTARIIHPPTRISIGALTTNCIQPKQNARVFRSAEGEIVFGTA